MYLNLQPAHMFIFHNILGITLSLYVLCIQIGPSLRKYRTHAHIYLCTQAKSFKRQNWLYPLYPKVTVIWRFLYNFILSRLWHIWHLFKYFVVNLASGPELNWVSELSKIFRYLNTAWLQSHLQKVKMSWNIVQPTLNFSDQQSLFCVQTNVMDLVHNCALWYITNQTALKKKLLT